MCQGQIRDAKEIKKDKQRKTSGATYLASEPKRVPAKRGSRVGGNIRGRLPNNLTKTLTT